MKKMHNPPHPGEVLKTLCMDPLNLTITETARSLGVSRKTLSSILNGRAGVSPEMAVRLSIAFDTNAESWLIHQLQYDLACGAETEPAPRKKGDGCVTGACNQVKSAPIDLRTHPLRH
jgi:addiction module HigA family antidote